jgi:hypothetical protein
MNVVIRGPETKTLTESECGWENSGKQRMSRDVPDVRDKDVLYAVIKKNNFEFGTVKT